MSTLAPLPLAEFLDHLRRHGFTIGVDQYLDVYQVLEQTTGDWNPGELKTLLGPIFARSAREQEAFYRAFDRYVGPFAPRTVEEDHRDASSPRVSAAPLRARWLPYFLLVIALAAVSGAVAVWWVEREPARPPVTSATPDDGRAAALPAPTAEVGRTVWTATAPAPGPGPAWARVWLRHGRTLTWVAVLTALAFWLSHEAYRWNRRRYALQGGTGTKPPSSWPIRTEDVLAKIYESAEFHSVSQRLNRRQEAEGERLDIESTVRATIEALGFPTPRYRRDRRPPEYLVLIDRRSYRDHQAELFSRLADAFADEQLLVETYFFDDDPRVCVSARDDSTEYLADMATPLGGRRLLIVGAGDGLLDAVTGRSAEWITLFSTWNERALLTPAPPASWGLRERVLGEQFAVVPATLQGLEALVDHFEMPWVAWPPRVAADALGPSAPEGAELQDVERLREYLGPEGFRWLCACAVYPELHWSLTLHLGVLLSKGGRAAIVAQLLRLVHLPWFRIGAIPDELRWRLLQQLDPACDSAVRQAILRVLELQPNRAPEGSFARDAQHLEIAFQRFWREREDRVRRRPFLSELRDRWGAHLRERHTLLRSLESVDQSALDVILPRRIGRLLYAHGVHALGLRTAARAALTLAIIVLAIGGGGAVGRWADQMIPVNLALELAHEGESLGGAQTRYAITVSNRGSKEATRVGVTATVSDSGRIVEGEPDPVSPRVVRGDQVVVFGPHSRLEPGRSLTHRLTVAIAPAGPQGVDVPVRAELTADGLAPAVAVEAQMAAVGAPKTADAQRAAAARRVEAEIQKIDELQKAGAASRSRALVAEAQRAAAEAERAAAEAQRTAEAQQAAAQRAAETQRTAREARTAAEAQQAAAQRAAETQRTAGEARTAAEAQQAAAQRAAEAQRAAAEAQKAAEAQQVAAQKAAEAQRAATEAQRAAADAERAAVAAKAGEAQRTAEASKTPTQTAKTAPDPSQVPRTGSVRINANVSGAEVWIGDVKVQLKDGTAEVADLSAGRYRVRARRDGYREWTGEVEVLQGRLSRLEISMSRLRLGSPPPF